MKHVLPLVLVVGSAGCLNRAEVSPFTSETRLTVLKPVVWANGADSSAVMVVLRGQHNLPVAGATVEIVSDSAGAVLTQPSAPTDANGMVTAYAASRVAANMELHARLRLAGGTYLDLPVSGAITFRKPTRELILQSSQAPTAGASFSAVVLAVDETGQPLIELDSPLRFSTTDPRASLPPEGTVRLSAGRAEVTGLALLRAGATQVKVEALGEDPLTGASDLLVAPAAASRVEVQLLPSITAGADASVTLIVTDAYGNPISDYVGSATITSSDPNSLSVVGVPYMTGADGSATLTVPSALGTAGTQTVIVADPALGQPGQATTTVLPAAPARFLLSGLPSVTALGAATDVVIEAIDAHGNRVTDYMGTVQWSSPDPSTTVPPTYTFVAADQGRHALPGSVTFGNGGPQSLSVVDLADPTISGTIQTWVAVPAPYLALSLSASTPAAGTAQSLTLVARTPMGAVDTAYTGTVHFTSTDPAASLPSDATFGPADAGTKVLSGLTFVRAGTTSLSGVDTSDPNIAGAVTVQVAPSFATQLAWTSAPASATAGQPFSMTLHLLDAYGNPATGYTGTLRFYSDDAQATLPAPYTLGAADGGTLTITAQLGTGGVHTVSAVDTVNGGVTATSSGISVGPGAAAVLQVTGMPAAVLAGSAGTVTVRARDTYGNLATGYTGTVRLSSTDPQASLPGDYTFVPADGGVHTWAGVVLQRAGTHGITATDTANVGLSGAQAGITVTAAPATRLQISGVPAAVMAGQAKSVTVTAYDPYGNVATGYVGTVQFTSTDPQATLPAGGTFAAANAGVVAYPSSLVFATAGTQAVTVTDTNTPSVTGTLGGIAVDAAAATTLVVSGLGATPTAGTPQSVSVTARDAYGNVAAGYTGTVHFTSTDAQAVLPGDTTWTAGDAGVVSLPSGVTLKTAGSQTLTATDTQAPGVSGVASATVQAAAAQSLALTGFPASVASGQGVGVTVKARDAYNNIATGYTGTVQFTSSDAQAILPANTPFGAADVGSKGFLVTLKTAGAASVTVTDVSVPGLTSTAAGITVTAGGTANLVVTGIADGVAGGPSSVTVRALDSQGNTATGYVGTVHFTSSDPQATLPADYAFVSADAGQHTFSNGVVLKTSGSQSVTAADTASAVFGAQIGITVSPAAAVVLTAAGLTGSVAGTSGSVTLTARDAYGNVAPGYTGTVHFASTDPQAVLPPDYVFTPGDAGAHTFAGAVTLKTVGAQSVSATDTVTASITGGQTGLVVTAAAAVQLTVTGVTGGPAGVVSSATVRAQDAYGNTATAYTGTVRLTCTDAQAVLPGNYAFVAADAGVHTFTSAVTLKTVGVHTVTGTDTVTGTLTGNQAGITVVSGSVTQLALSGLVGGVAGGASSATVKALDAYGNTVTTYTGTVQFTSTDPQAVLPANYAFVAGDVGVHTFTNGVTLKTAGTQSVTATDTVTSGITGSQSGLAVAPGSATQLTVTGIAGGAAGVISSATVKAQDAYGNTATGYTGTVRFTSTDAQAVLPANYAFVAGDAGVRIFTNGVTLKTVGTQSVTATDTVTASITGSQSGLTVTPGSATQLTVTGLAGGTAGVASSATVRARDAYGNTVVGYVGTVRFTSTDVQAVLPANYAFVAGDAGVHTFTNGVTLKTAGTQSVTATDTVTASITGSQSGLTVTPGSATQLTVTGVAGGAAGASLSATVKALDAYGNTATGYTGTVRFTSTDGVAVLPANYPFVAGDAGLRTFTNGLTFKTAGTQSVTATDTVTGSITGSQTNIVVTAAAATTLTVSGVTGGAAPAISSVTVRAKDAYGNTATGYTGRVAFTSTDAQAALPASYTFVSGDAGVHTFSNTVTLKTVGTQSVTATDTVTSSISGTQSGVSVSAGSTSKFALSALSAAQVGQRNALTVTATDAYGNLTTGYTGTVHFTSSDASAVLPVNYTFLAGDAGVHAFTVLFGTQGTQSVTATDTVTSSITGSRTGIAISAGTLTASSTRANGTNAFHLCAAIGGLVKCWGWNNLGGLGYGDTLDRGGAPNQMGTNLPYVQFAAGESVLQVATQSDQGSGEWSCAVTDANQVKCWGYNRYGQLGLGDTKNRYAPSVALSFGSGRSATDVALGQNHGCAILDTRQLACWGRNDRGQLGLGDTLNRSTPGPVVNVGAGRSVLSVSGGYGTTCAVLDDASLKCWGSNVSGQLGLGDTTDRKTPVAVALGAGRTASLVRASQVFTCAVLDTGAVTCWGANPSGQLGLGDTTSRTSPAASTVSFGAGRTAQSVATGYATVCALIDTGDVRCWGSNSGQNAGTLGMGDTINRLAPNGSVNFGAGRTAIGVFGGATFQCAVLDTGRATCWGNNNTSYLGQGDLTARGRTPSEIPALYPPISL
jgi:alpha-tubulin suppressor-like RCC1 family protein